MSLAETLFTLFDANWLPAGEVHRLDSDRENRSQQANDLRTLVREPCPGDRRRFSEISVNNVFVNDN